MAKRTATTATALGRMAIRGASGNRWLRAVCSGAQTTFRAVARSIRVLGLQIAGLFFAAFAVTFAMRLPRAYSDYAAGRSPKSHLILLAGLTVMFGWFALSSFWRSRKK